MRESTPLYTSAARLLSLGNRYRVFKDRIELEARFLFRRFVIPADEIVSVGLFPPIVFLSNPLALKLDLADLRTHVCLKRRHGLFKKLAFTPDDPGAFIEAVKSVSNSKLNESNVKPLE